MLGLWKNNGLTFTGLSSSARSLGPWLVGECRSAKEPRRHIYGIVAVVNLVRRWNLQRSVDGLVEGRIGVQVRSEEVLNDGGIRKSVMCAMLLCVKTNVFAKTQRLSHMHVLHMWETLTSTDTTNKEHCARKITCTGTWHCVLVWCPVYTHRRFQGNRHCL